MTKLAASLPVLTFHALEDEPDVISFSSGLFRRGIAMLYENGYRTLALSDIIGFLSRGLPFPARHVVITFDDGYRSVYEEAFPVLQQYGMSATVFITVGKTDKVKSGERLPSLAGKSMLSWQEMRKMQQSGIAFGAHTLTHPDLTRVPLNRINAEVQETKIIIEDALGVQVLSFAYPYGRYNRLVRGIVREHFACACSDKLGLISPSSDIYALERVDAYYLRTDRLFSLMVTRSFPWHLLARSIPRRLRRTLQM